MKRRVLYILIYLLVSTAFVYARDTSSVRTKIFIESFNFNSISLVDSLKISSYHVKECFNQILKIDEVRKLSVRFDPSFSFRFKPAVVFEIIGESGLAFDWKGGGVSQASIPRVELVDAGVSVALYF